MRGEMFSSAQQLHCFCKNKILKLEVQDLILREVGSIGGLGFAGVSAWLPRVTVWKYITLANAVMGGVGGG